MNEVLYKPEHSSLYPLYLRCSVFLLLSLLLTIIYSNTFDSHWQMDDKPNILDNPGIHIDDLMPSTLFKTFYAHPGNQQKPYRPIPMLTFAFNWYLGKNNPFGFHFVNLLLHILTTWILFLTIWHLFHTPVLKDKFTKDAAFFISLLSITLWGVNPIQTQAVTYIVQRMTIMASLFYFLGLLFYIKARLVNIPIKKVIFLSGCSISFLLALGSKENAAIFPLSLILMEFIFFQPSITQKLRSRYFVSVIIIGLSVFIALIFLFTKGNPFFFTKGYGSRTFTWVERILTQPRVVLFYLSLIFYPLPQRLSVDHDIEISGSLIEPWTNLAAIIVLLLFLFFGIYQAKKRPLISFPICFFFLNHLIESSVIPLEMIFEHRNYLPSAFLFLPIAAFFYHLLKIYRNKSRTVYAFLALSLSSIIFLFGIGTYTRNMAWASKMSLWKDAASKASKNARPLVNVAIELGWKRNASRQDVDKALSLLYRANSLYNPSRIHNAQIFANLGGLYYRIKAYKKAIEAYKKALLINPSDLLSRYNLAQSLLLMERFNEASKQLDFIFHNGHGKYPHFNLKGVILLWQNRPNEAIPYLRKALRQAPGNASVLMNLGISLSRLDSHEKAEWFLKRALQSSPNDVYPYFAIIENAVKAYKTEEAEIYAHRLLSIRSIDSILSMSEKLSTTFIRAPISSQLVAPIIEDAFLKKLKVLSDEST